MKPKHPNSFSYKELLPLQIELKKWLNTYNQVKNKSALDKSHSIKKNKIASLLTLLSKLIKQQYETGTNTNNEELDKLKAALETKISSLDLDYKTLNFEGAKSLSITIGNLDEVLFTNTQTEIDKFLVDLEKYMVACKKESPIDLNERKNWGDNIRKNWKSKLNKINNAHSFILNGTTNLTDPTTTKGYKDVTSKINTVKAKWDKKLKQLNLLKQLGTISTAQEKEMEEFNTYAERIDKYQDDLMELIGNNKIKIKRHPTSTTINDIVLDNGTLTVRVTPSNQKEMIAHEMQHLIQVTKGQLGLLNNGTGTVNFLYDMNDEVEAYQVQYLLAPNSVPGTELLRKGIGTGASKNGPIFIHNYADINVNAIALMASQENISAYAGLPSDSYTILDTIEKLSTHPHLSSNIFKEIQGFFLEDNNIIKTDIDAVEKDIIITEMWELNKINLLTDKFIIISCEENKTPIKKVDGTYQFIESEYTLMDLYKAYIKFTCK